MTQMLQISVLLHFETTKIDKPKVVSLWAIGDFLTFTGGWKKIKIKDHLSLTEKEIRAELGNTVKSGEIQRNEAKYSKNW